MNLALKGRQTCEPGFCRSVAASRLGVFLTGEPGAHAPGYVYFAASRLAGEKCGLGRDKFEISGER